MGFEVGKEEPHQELWDAQPAQTKDAASEKTANKKGAQPAQKPSFFLVLALTMIVIFISFLLTEIMAAFGH